MTLAQKPRKIPKSLDQQLLHNNYYGRVRLTNDNPELPEHDESAANASWCHFSGENGNRGILRSDSDAHDEARSKEFVP